MDARGNTKPNLDRHHLRKASASSTVDSKNTRIDSSPSKILPSKAPCTYCELIQDHSANMQKKIVPLALLLILAASMAGCSKKPQRPNPMDTVIGQDADSSSSSRRTDDTIAPFDIESDGGLLERRSDFSGFSSGLSTKEILARADRGEFEPIYFQFDSSAIAPQERAKLQSVAESLADNPGMYLVLEGHCDWRGTQEYNLALGDRRAKSVLNYLSTLGVASSRLQPLSQGDLKASEGASSATMTKERRVEILVIR